MRSTPFRLFVVSIVAVVLGLALQTAAAPPPRPVGCECAYIELPVLCSDGKVYLNPCVAACFGQEDCELIEGPAALR
jgi:hypothetical protein